MSEIPHTEFPPIHRSMGCTDAKPCRLLQCDTCFDREATLACSASWGAKSDLKCTLREGHAGGHDFRYPATEGLAAMAANPPTYFILKNKGLFLCCIRYLKNLNTQATAGNWTPFTDGFRTRCTGCKGWVRLKGNTFEYDINQTAK
jgi:hypothetical protein